MDEGERTLEAKFKFKLYESHKLSLVTITGFFPSRALYFWFIFVKL